MITMNGKCANANSPFLYGNKRFKFVSACACPDNVAIVQIGENESIVKRK